MYSIYISLYILIYIKAVDRNTKLIRIRFFIVFDSDYLEKFCFEFFFYSNFLKNDSNFFFNFNSNSIFSKFFDSNSIFL